EEQFGKKGRKRRGGRGLCRRLQQAVAYGMIPKKHMVNKRRAHMTILVIDGQGGKLGRQLVKAISERFPQEELVAVGTNSAATANLLKGGAQRGATGENAVLVACRRADIIVGPVGIVVADSLMGEVTP